MKGNKYKCSTCGAEYIHCPQCESKAPSYDAQVFCSKSHADIFAILSKHGCKLATAEETLKALRKYNLDAEKLTPAIRKHIATIKAEVKPTVEVKPVEEEKLNDKEEKK